jgi:hypothetical protein
MVPYIEIWEKSKDAGFRNPKKRLTKLELKNIAWTGDLPPCQCHHHSLKNRRSI